MWKKPTSIAKKNSTASRSAISSQDIEKVLRSLTTKKSGLDFWLDFSRNQSIKYKNGLFPENAQAACYSRG